MRRDSGAALWRSHVLPGPLHLLRSAALLALSGLVLGMILRFPVVCSSADQVDESAGWKSCTSGTDVSFKLSG